MGVISRFRCVPLVVLTRFLSDWFLGKSEDSIPRHIVFLHKNKHSERREESFISECYPLAEGGN